MLPAWLTISTLLLGHPGASRLFESPVTCLDFNPNGDVLAVGGGRTVYLVDAASGCYARPLKTMAGRVTSVRFSPDGSWLAASGGVPGRSGEIRLWKMSKGGYPPPPKQVTGIQRQLSGPADVIYDIAWNRTGDRVAGVSYDHSVNLWQLVKPTTPKELTDHTDAVYGVAFSPDGRRVASAAGDRTVKVWDADTGKRMFTLSDSTAELYTVQFSPDGRRIAAAGVDRTVRVWDITAKGGSLHRSAIAHPAPIIRLTYSPDGRYLYTAGEGGVVKQLDADTLAEKRVFPKQPDWPHGLAISRDGQRLAVGQHDGTLTIYDTHTGKVAREIQIKSGSFAALRMTTERTPSVALRMIGGRTPRRALRMMAARSRGLAHRSALGQISKQAEPPRTSNIPGVKPGTKEKRPRKKGGPTLFAASLGKMVPTGAVRGKTTRFTLYGGLISDATAAYFDDPEIHGKIIAPPDSNKGVLKVDTDIGTAARIGIHRVYVLTPHGTTGSVTFAVGDWQEIGQTEPNDDPAHAQSVPIPCTVTGALDKPGDVDDFAIEANAGDEIVFDVIAQQIRSRLQPVLTLFDSNGRSVAESSPRIGKPDTLLGYKFAAAGRFTLQLKDFEGAGGGDVHYRLNIGRFPVITEVFPRGLRLGTEAELSVKGFNLKSDRVKVTAPFESSWAGTMDIPYPGWLLSSPRIAVGYAPEVIQRSGSDSIARAQLVSLPTSINGRLSSGSNYYRFHAIKGKRLIVDVMARRLGSPLDSEIEILDSRGKPLERAVIRAVSKTEMVLNDRDSATSALRLQVWDDYKLNDYIMVGREVVRVSALPKGPDEDVFFRSQRGQRVTYFGTTAEFHTLGSPVYKIEAYPPGSNPTPNGYPIIRLVYANDDGGPLYGKDSMLEFDPPADGEYVVRIADTRGQSGEDYFYRLGIHPPRPDYKVTLSPEHVNVPKGGATVMDVACERYEGFEGPINVRLLGLPRGVTATDTTIEPGEISAQILVTAAPDAVTPAPDRSDRELHARGPSGLFLEATAMIAGREVRHVADPPMMRLITVLPNPDVKVATDRREIVIHPGEEITVEASVERQGEFGARVPIEVKNLPFGVRVQDVGLSGVLVTEDEDSRKFTIRCEPWVKPQTRVIYTIANVEGGVATAAAPMKLVIMPATQIKSRSLRDDGGRSSLGTTGANSLGLMAGARSRDDGRKLAGNPKSKIQNPKSND